MKLYQPVRSRGPATILHLLGNTGVGKTTLMDKLTARNSDACVGISVGRELRKKYPPEYFAGQAAPAHTEVEALQLYKDFVGHYKYNRSLIIVDGQPRKNSQVAPILEAHPECRHVFLLLHATHETRESRLLGRDSSDSEKWKLSSARLDADYRNSYEVMVGLAQHGIELTVADCNVLSQHAIVEGIEREYL